MILVENSAKYGGQLCHLINARYVTMKMHISPTAKEDQVFFVLAFIAASMKLMTLSLIKQKMEFTY